MNNEVEIWKDVPGYEGLYQCSNLGRVKSIKRSLIMAQYLNIEGYYQLSLNNNKIQRLYKVHQLVAMCFLNHIPNGVKVVVDHIDHNGSNNNVNNLQLLTNRENSSKRIDKSKKSSKYTGVSFDKSRNKWQSKLQINRITVHLGRFDNEYDAHIAYQNKLKSLDNE